MLTPGTRLGPYEIVGPLGAGGMGEVYRARDTRLGREVAIKVLPQHLSSHPEVRARFEREAKTVSALNHPHICVLFDVGREGDTDYLVMELIEGDTLADRLKRGPLSSAELLRFATQIADALDRAHRAGVIHRDLKPGNIMLTKSGAKLMDFGLSRAAGMGGSPSGSSQSPTAFTQSPTVAQALTAEGALVGTFQYMAPEQLEGREADARSDLWAFGCVLYEMATGRRAFEGRSQASLIAAILEREPPAIGEVPSGSGTFATGGPPHGLDRLIRTCIAKDPDDRIQTAHDAKLQLQWIAESAGMSSTSVVAPASVAAAGGLPRARGASSAIAWGIAAAGLLAAVAAVAWLYPRATARKPAMRFHVGPVPRMTEMYWPRVSPDGRFLVMQVADSAGITRAYVRPMDQIEAHPIPGTEGLQRAYWSPDSREIAFVAADKIQRVSIAGGSPVVVTAAPGGADLSWGSKGQILMDGQPTDSLRVVPAGGGELRPATRIDRAAGEIGSAWPCFLPDGEHFLFIGTLSTTAGPGDIRLGKIGSLDSKLLGRSDGRAEYAPGGWVLFVRGTSLLAQKLDVGAARLTGQPITVAENVRLGNAQGHFSISNDGILSFARLNERLDRTMTLVNRSGTRVGRVLPAGVIGNPSTSPDGRRLLYQKAGSSGAAGADVFVFDLDRGTDTRLTFTNDIASTPVWSPDGRRFAYVTRPAGAPARVRIGSADGLGAQDSIALPEGMSGSLTQWAAAGSRLVFVSSRARPYAIPTEGGGRTPQGLVDSAQIMVQAQISPDGRWVAGTMGTVPNVQVFVQSLAGPPGRWQITSGGGINPRWTRSGREIVYEAWNGPLMAVEVDARETFQAGTPRVLFPLPSQSFRVDEKSWGCDDAGERFFLVAQPRLQNAGIIEVMTDFRSLVTRK